MATELIIREGYHECPACKAMFKITDPDVDDGDGFCDTCIEDGNVPVRLVYVGETMNNK